MSERKQTYSFQPFIAMIRRIVFIIITMIITIIMYIIIGSFCLTYLPKSYKNEVGGQGVYMYSEKDFFRVLKTVGYSKFWRSRSQNGYGYHVSRNSMGTELRFVHPTKHKVFILSCNGSIKEIDAPGYPAWCNDAQEVVAWRQLGRVHYTYGHHSEPIACAFGPGRDPDPAGKFFIKTPNPSCPDHPVPPEWWKRTEIYAIEKPYQLLTTVQVCGGGQIFFKDETIFLFGGTCDEQRKETGELHMLQVNGENLKEREIVGIPEPESPEDVILVKDLSPWSDEVLLESVYDCERSIYYVFNFRTHEMKKLGREPRSGGRGFFLQCDILQEVTKKLEESRESE